MEDLTDEQVQEIIMKYYPENPEEIRAAFDQMKNELQLTNYETVVMIQKQMQGDQAALGAEQPANIPPSGAFADLAARVRR